MYIAKPSVGGKGDGIILVKKPSEIPNYAKDWIVQSYIDRPPLLDGKKFELRLFMLVSSVDPYFCYLCEEGLASFCV